MEVDSFEWSLSSIFVSHEEHTDNPKEENIISCFEYICWVVFFEELTRCIEIPVENRKRPESTRKPCIENILVSYNIFLSILCIEFLWICCYSQEFPCFMVIVCRNLMSPPELTRDAPVTQIIDPVFKCFIKSFRENRKLSFLISRNYFFCHDICFYKPLCRNNRLDTTLSTRTKSNLMSIGFNLYEISFAF